MTERPITHHLIEEAIKQQIDFIGDDPTREGLLKTPYRVVKSWVELYKGYKMDPAEVFTTFDSGGCNQIVLLKNIELYSMCEHHMLPFFGKAHIAYIPNGRVIGVSKLARLLDIFARRLQIQERIGMQVTKELNKHLNPLGAACIIEAKHMCMCTRGVNKQNSTMVTSDLTGVFLNNPETRQELMSMIK